jgi:hypothetical protein
MNTTRMRARHTVQSTPDNPPRRCGEKIAKMAADFCVSEFSSRVTQFGLGRWRWPCEANFET